MHVYFLSYNFFKKTPSTRYRGIYPLKALSKKYKIKTTLYYRKQDIFYLIYLYIKIYLNREESIVIFQRIVKKDKISFIMEKIRKIAKISILDIDDAIEELAKEEKTKNYIYEWISKVNQVWVGSEELKKNYTKYNKNIKLMPTPVPDVFLTNKTKNDLLTIGWIGNYKPHKKNLDMFFKEIKNIDIKLTLKLVGITDKKIQTKLLSFFNETNISLEFPIVKKWQNEQEISDILQTIDIGIMPQLNTKYDRAKSAFKIKQYFASGVPALASPVGENLKVIKDGINGYIVKDGEWGKFLKVIALHKNAIKDLGENAISEYKKSDYFMDNYVNKIFNIIS